MTDPLEPLLERFELAWRDGPAPSLLEFVREQDPPAPREALIELVLVDMEYRWRGAAPEDAIGKLPHWQHYLEQLPELGPARELPAWAVAEQAQILRSLGHDVSDDWMMAAFPEQVPELVGCLRRVAREAAADGGTQRPAPVDLSRADPRAPLPYADYLLEAHLGAGGMGKVYRARQQSMDRQVAVKALLKSRQHDGQAVDQFVREAQTLGRLRHPSIVGVHGLGRFPGGGYFLVMDLIDGQDLQQQLAAGPLAPRRAVPLMIEVAAAIRYAHEQGVLHCDLKPSNVLVDSCGRAHVADFGMAVLAGSAERPLGGTPAYMAPEQLDSQWGEIGERTDVFGLGGVLLAALTGRPPREPRPGESLAEATARPVDAAALLQNAPAELGALCQQCLAASPSDRVQTAAEVLSRLRL